MDEPSGAPPLEDTHTEVTEPTPTGDTGTDWEERYKSLQADHTRKSQALKEAEPATQWYSALQSDDTRSDALQQLAAQYGEAAVLEALGYDVGADTEDTPDEFRDPRVDELLQQREAEKAEAKQQEQLAALDSHVAEQIKAIEGDGPKLDEKTQRFIVAHAVASLPPGEDGLPQIQQAYNDLKEMRNAWQQEWLQSKKAPHVTAGGGPGEPAPDLTDPRVRRQVSAEIFQANLPDD